IWVEALFKDMPGGAIGFLIVVNLLIFILGCFIDFLEIAFIVVPILAPVADKILAGYLPPGTPQDMVLIWFGVVIAMNLQTSFLTPPFGFALFYLRSVAAKKDYKDRVTGQSIPAVATSQIYKGSIAFIILQLIMVAVVIASPQLVTGGIQQAPQVDFDKALQQLEIQPRESQKEEPAGQPVSAPGAPSGAPAGGSGDARQSQQDDPMRALLEAMKEDQQKGKK
ncbi:MAG: hypothetical protein RIS88_2856, partial [Pseudomonadota bacterium]